MAQDLKRPVGDDLVGIHVGGRAGSSLDHVHHELIVERAGLDFVAGGNNRLGPLGIELSQLHVRPRRRHLDLRERADQIRIV
ncbi:hypothetical protein D9M72_567930 [compost metagenome]